MALKTWQFFTIMLTSVWMASALCHLMELPAKMTYDGPLYVKLHRTLYPMFGRTAGIAEVLAVIAVIGLAWRVRDQPAYFLPTLISAILLVSAHAVFWILVQPANTTMAAWSLEAIPADWTHWRDRWEYSHAARAGLTLVALGALVLSLLRGRP